MIRFEHVSKQYSGTTRPALNGINLEVLRGEFVFLVGASGSGKSSCLRLILKEERPTKGAIHVLGQDLGSISSRKVPYFRRNIGVVFQDFRLLPNKTVFQNVAFTLQVIGKSRGFIQEAVPDVLKMVGLDGKAQRLPHELSGGEQQRVAIARAVVNKPQILLADEPTGNLDPATSAGIMSVLAQINAGGTTVLMATHEAAIVDQMKQRVVELVGGQIVRDERHGGYGVTTSIPLPRPTADGLAVPAETSTGVVPVPPPPAPVVASAAASASEPMTRPHAPVANPTGPVTVGGATGPVQPIEPVGPVSAPVQAVPAPVPATVPATGDGENLPDHLNFTANLDLSGLRDASDRDGEQNVGPTK
ncbi:MAG: cell division ATP-binding protein FtsE [Actinobacteria bacterium]|nr:cell division ATP-binding protein FtsE [Actinomycetota bacterium]